MAYGEQREAEVGRTLRVRNSTRQGMWTTGDHTLSRHLGGIIDHLQQHAEIMKDAKQKSMRDGPSEPYIHVKNERKEI